MTAAGTQTTRRSRRRQIDLFPETVAPRRRRVMMHVHDAGDVPGIGCAVHVRCGRCGFDTGWIKERSVSAEKAGRPCPVCNPDDAEALRLARDGGYVPGTEGDEGDDD